MDYKKKRNIMIDALKSAGLEDCTPPATLYIWQKTPKGIDSVEFAKRLLQKETAVVVTPGKWISKDFNGLNPGNDYVRFASVPTMEECKIAGERLKKLMF